MTVQKRVLITGGAGFLGSHLVKRHLDLGNQVICLDNLQTGRKTNIESFLDHPGFEFVRHDITQPYFAEVDLVLNFACPASPPRYQSNPIKTFKTSVLGTMNMLGLAKRVGARFVQASTSEVYGDPLTHPQPESYWGNVNPIGVRSCYDEGKRAAETLVYDYERTHGVDVRVVRIFNTYGPHMDPFDGRVVSNFIIQALKGKPLSVYGQGEQTRSFCYCDDLIDGIMALAEQNDYKGPINLGNQVEFRVMDLAKEVLKQTQSNSEIRFHPLPSDDPQVRRPDLSLAEKYLHFKPKIPLKEGLEKTIPYFKKEIDRLHI